MADNHVTDMVIRRVLRSTISNYIGKFITLGVWFVLTPFILRHIGASMYGLWVLVGSVVAYGSLFDLSIASAITKYIAEYRAKRQTDQARCLIATCLCLYSLLGLIVVALSAVIAPIFPDLFNVPPDERATAIWLVLLSGLGVGLSIPCATVSAVLRGLQRFDLINLISIVGTLLSTAATVAVLLLGGGIIGIVVVSVAVMVSMQAPGIWCIHRVAPELRFGRWGASRQLVRTVASFSWSLFVIDFGGQIETKTDEVVIGAFLPINAVTPYHIARKLSELPVVLSHQFMKVLMPLASELHAENDEARLRSLYTISTRLTLATSVPFGCTLFILAQSILSAWVGVGYAEYEHLVLILTLASLIDTSQWPAGFVLQGMTQHRPLAVMSIYSGLANLALSVVLVRFFGLTGVALGTLIPTSIVCLGFVLPYTMRLMGVSAREAITDMFFPALLPAVPMAILIYCVRELFKPSSLLSITVVAGIGLLVYVIGYLSVSASEVERRTVRRLALSTIGFAEGALKRS